MASESCSSTENNGCSSCAPSLILFSLSTSTSQSKVGYGCLDGSNASDRYFNKSIRYNGTRTSTLKYCAQDGSGEIDTEILVNNGSSSEINTTKSFVNKFGDILFYTITYYNNNPSFNLTWICGSYGANLNQSIYDSANPTDCPLNSNIETITSCAYRAYGNNSCIDPPESYNDSYSECCPFPESPQICVSNGPTCSELNPTITTTVSCTKEIISANASYDIPVTCDPCCSTGDKKQCNATTTTSINEKKDLSFFYNLCQSSVSTKIGILEANQPQNCAGTTCGEGKDACWGAASSFSITDNNLDDPNANSTIAQKLKFKIGTLKEGFEKEYKSVSGKVKFYIPSSEDVEEDRTPCCSDDFSGTVVKEAGYSISAGSTFKNDYLASDAGDFDNTDQSRAGETINICYTIDNVSFM